MKMKRIFLIGSLLIANASKVYGADTHRHAIHPFDLIPEILENPPTVEQLEGMRPADLLTDDGLTEIAQSDTFIGPIDLYAYCVVESKLRSKTVKKEEAIRVLKEQLATKNGEARYESVYIKWLIAYHKARKAMKQ